MKIKALDIVEKAKQQPGRIQLWHILQCYASRRFQAWMSDEIYA